MAENDNNENGNTASNTEQAVNQPQGPVFALQRIYLKDASFESPRSPETFQGQWTPKITFNLSTRNTRLAEGVYDAVLTLTIEAKMDENVAFLVEVQQAGVFTCMGFNDAELEHVLAAVCPNILFPYARETIDSLVTRGSFPAIMLAPVNFEALFMQQKQQQAAQQAAGASAPAADADKGAVN
jgi:preprotein translocase subunit SecB